MKYFAVFPFCLFVILSLCLSAQEKHILFADKKLANVICSALDKPQGTPLSTRDVLRVFDIDASGVGISSLKGIEYCRNITELNISDNTIDDISPLDALRNLISLNCSHNAISSAAPLKGLKMLEQLNISNNKLKDASHLSSCTSLVELKAAGNGITDIDYISSLSGLTFLDLSYNDISSINSLKPCVHLRHVYLNNNDLTDIGALAFLRSIKTLNLSHNSIKNITPLKYLKGVEKCMLSHNSISDLFPLREMYQLRILRLDNNAISDIDLISGLSSLQFLDFSSNNVRSIEKLKKLSGLTYLNGSGNRISDISVLSALTDLQVLLLSDNSISDIEALSHLTKLGDNETVDIDCALNGNNISDFSPLIRNPGFGSGDAVDISNNPVSDKTALFSRFASKGIHLIYLFISGERIIPDDGSVSLRAYDISGTEKEDVTDMSVWSIVRGESYAACDDEKKGVIHNTNTSGRVQNVTVEAVRNREDTISRARKELRVLDAVRIHRIEIDGPDAVDTQDSIQLHAYAYVSGNDDKKGITHSVEWSVAKKDAQYASFSSSRPGLLVNTNTTGSDRKITVICSLGGEGVSEEVRREITAAGSPFITDLHIEGPDTVPEDGTVSLHAVLEWVGKDKEDITDNVTWTIQEGKAYGVFVEGSPGVFENRNKSGSRQIVEISALYSSPKGIKKAGKKLVAVDFPDVSDILIIGSNLIPAGKEQSYSAQVILSDGEKRDSPDTAVWSIESNGDNTYAEFDRESVTVLNKNSSGMPQNITIRVRYSAEEDTFTAQKDITLQSAVILSDILIDGPSIIKENASELYTGHVKRQGEGKSVDNFSVTWSVEPDSYTEEERGSSGKILIINANDTGSPVRITLTCTVLHGEMRRTASKKITLQDSPYLSGLRIDGLGFIMEGIWGEYRAKALYKGAKERDVTTRAAFKVTRGGEYVSFGEDEPHKIINNNRTGEDKSIVLHAEYIEDGILQRTEKEIVVMDDPFLKGISIVGNEENIIPEDGMLAFQAEVTWSDGKRENKTGETSWEITRGKPYAAWDPDVPGTLHNKNTTGTEQSITIQAVFGGPERVVQTDIEVVCSDTPYIRSFSISGPDTIAYDERVSYSGEVDWVGKRDESISTSIEWEVSSGGEWARFSEKTPGELINTNNTGEKKNIEIKAVYNPDAGETTFTAYKNVTVYSK